MTRVNEMMRVNPMSCGDPTENEDRFTILLMQNCRNYNVLNGALPGPFGQLVHFLTHKRVDALFSGLTNLQSAKQ
jgi:hypothetical protein